MDMKRLKRPAGPSVRYHGLKNHGALCYLNSVLQVLFMTRDFRQSVHSSRSSRKSDCIDGQLTSLFDKLENRTSHVSDQLRKELGVNTVSEQRDAAEFFEKILTHTSSEASKVFHGELTHRTRCSTCDTVTATDGHFWHLPLDLMDSNSKHYSVVDGVEKYFQTTRLSEENQIYCEVCDSKRDVSIDCVIKYHPLVLTLLLKRFEFDINHMTHVKTERDVDIPLQLRLPQNQMYELYAMVEHVGNLKNGHYTALIKSQDDDKWYNFNDSSVTLLDFQPFQVDPTDRSSSAYLLFYRKKTIKKSFKRAPEDNGANKEPFHKRERDHEEKTDSSRQPEDRYTKKPRRDSDEKGKHVEKDNGFKYRTSPDSHYHQGQNHRTPAKTEPRRSEHDRKEGRDGDSQRSHQGEGGQEEGPKLNSSSNRGDQNQGRFQRHSVPLNRDSSEGRQRQTRDQEYRSAGRQRVGEEEMLRKSLSTEEANQKQGPAALGHRGRKKTTETTSDNEDKMIESLQPKFENLTLSTVKCTRERTRCGCVPFRWSWRKIRRRLRLERKKKKEKKKRKEKKYKIISIC